MTGAWRGACWVTLSSALVLGGCGETVQTTGSGSQRSADSKGWDSNGSRYVAPGWTAGDRGTWEAQLRSRAKAQDDYAR
jgi:hypothetical protein